MLYCKIIDLKKRVNDRPQSKFLCTETVDLQIFVWYITRMRLPEKCEFTQDVIYPVPVGQMDSTGTALGV